MSVSSAPASARPDACPGALRLHQAADGALARVRVPGGRICPAALRALAAAAARMGDGHLELTSRGNIQLRGLAPDAGPALAAILSDAGLLPSVAHERARNVVASPLSGLDGAGHGDVSALVAALDARLCSDAALATLSGRFLFALDDGRGDVATLDPDLAWRALSTGVGALLVAGADTGIRVDRDHAVGALLTLARLFLRLRAGDEGVWRVRDLPGGAAALVETAREELPGAGDTALPANPAPDTPSPGPVHRGAERVGRIVTAPFGRLTAAQARLLAVVAGAAPLRVTPWRGIVIPGAGAASTAAEARLREAGLVVDADSPWVGVSACVGEPGCAKAVADVRAVAARSVELELAASESEGRSDARRPVHWVGCERACGHPAGAHVAVLATGPGNYRVSAGSTSAQVPAAVATGRVAELRGEA